MVAIKRVEYAKVKCETITGIENSDYAGEKFPAKYLEPENYIPTKDDLDTYLNGMMKTVSYFSSKPNETDVNVAVGLFFMRAMFKRTLKDYGNKFDKEQYTAAREMMKMSDWVLSHYIYKIKIQSEETGNLFQNGIELGLTRTFSEEDNDLFTYSIGDFQKNKLRQWILSKGSINEYLEEIDAATLPKEKYVKLVTISTSSYHIRITSSDTCLSRIGNVRRPSLDDIELRPCNNDTFCYKSMHSSPSIAYGLSHRLLNLMMYRFLRRCYWVSPRGDMMHIDILCAFMYRETVYLARKGYFFRDLFLEHGALCSFMGYQEFFRRHWFHKVISWIDEEGCVNEFPNFIKNRSAIYNEKLTNVELRKENLKKMKTLLAETCHTHQMALLLVFIAHAIRHAVHFMQ